MLPKFGAIVSEHCSVEDLSLMLHARLVNVKVPSVLAVLKFTLTVAVPLLQTTPCGTVTVWPAPTLINVMVLVTGPL